MKKVIIFLFVVTVVLMTVKREEQIIIPEQSIRFRIIANSNSVSDQLLKLEIRNELIPVLNQLSSDTYSKTKDNINNNLELIDTVVGKKTDSFNVNFGQNYFPEKIYDDVVYGSGNYESLVITLGSGIGDNWWCVLFPPLCVMEATKENSTNVSYKSYVKTIINKYF